MDETAADIIDRETALANFDHARDDFEDAYSVVPDEALSFKPEGDEYTIGFLLPHITSVLKKYAGLVDKIREAGYGEVRLLEDERPDLSLGMHISRETELAEMEAAHDTLAGKLRELAYEEFGRQAPVIYPGTTEVYPSSAADIIGWVTEHYQEHIVHVAELMGKWRNET